MKFHKDQKGFSLVEILVATAILGIGISITAAYLTNSNLFGNFERRREMQRLIADRIVNLLSNPESLARSTLITSFENVLFKKCVEGSGSCPATNPANPFPFYLADPQQGSVVRLSGPPNTVFYDWDGKICVPTDAKCIFSAQTSFWVTCPIDRLVNPPAPAATCSVPSDFNFRYKVALIPGRVTAEQFAERFTDYPPQVPGEPFGNDLRMRRADILTAMKADRCPIDTRQTGIKSNGQAQCECVVPKLDASGNPVFRPNGDPVCSGQSCGPNQVMIGYDGNGKIQCLDQNACIEYYRTGSALATLCPCSEIDIANAATSNCANGYWLVSITWGQCWAVTDKSKANPDVVKCDQHKGLCCKLDAY